MEHSAPHVTVCSAPLRALVKPALLPIADAGPKVGTLKLSQTNAELWKRVVSVGTTEETITFDGITTNGIVYLYNQDPTNYVEVGFSTGVY